MAVCVGFSLPNASLIGCGWPGASIITSDFGWSRPNCARSVVSSATTSTDFAFTSSDTIASTRSWGINFLGAARDGDRVDTAVKLQQALLLLLERALGLDARLNPEINRQQDKKNNRVENCGPCAHAKNLLRTSTVIAIRNRIAGSTTEPRISTWRAS